MAMEAPQVAFTPEEIAQRGMDNWQHVLFGTIAYLKERDLSIEEWAAFLGEKFAPGWGHGYTARKFMEQAALNVVSACASRRSLAVVEDWAECVVGDCQPQSKRASYGIGRIYGHRQVDVSHFL